MRRTVQLALAAILLNGSVVAPLGAQSSTKESSEGISRSTLEIRAEQIIPLINGEIEPAEVLSDGFIAEISAEQFKTIASQLTTQFGAALAVEDLDPFTGTRAALSIRMERAIARGGIAIDPSSDSKVSELLFQTFDPVEDSLAKIEADLNSLSGELSWWMGPLDGSVAAVTAAGAERHMPIGSTFKLYVLATLAREVAEGKRSWTDTFVLSDRRSFPSGMLQDWPKDAPLTLHTAASLMISISDNTATDALIGELGRQAIQETMVESGHSDPELNDPFLTTRELFLLKGGPPGRLQTYLRGTADVRRQILEGIEDIDLPTSDIAAAFAGPPVALDVEWFASPTDIVNLLRYMRRNADPEAFAIMAINPSIPDGKRGIWRYVGYKGGSEPGVYNLSWLLQDKSGRDHALILSWRDDNLRFNPAPLELIAQRLLFLEP